MIPPIFSAAAVSRALVVIDQVFEEFGMRLPVGTMIETPRAVLLAGEIAPLVYFFGFGTNDLTQLTYGVSRDDAGRPRFPHLARVTFLEHHEGLHRLTLPDARGADDSGATLAAGSRAASKKAAGRRVRR